MVTLFDPLKILIIYVNLLTPKTLLFTREKFSVFYTELKFVQFLFVFAQIWCQDPSGPIRGPAVF